MKKLLIATVAITLLTPLGGCDRTATPVCTDDAFVMTVAAPKPPAPKAPKVQQPKPKAPVVKEPKRDGNGGVIVDTNPYRTQHVDFDDDCDDDD